MVVQDPVQEPVTKRDILDSMTIGDGTSRIFNPDDGLLNQAFDNEGTPESRASAWAGVQTWSDRTHWMWSDPELSEVKAMQETVTEFEIEGNDEEYACKVYISDDGEDVVFGVVFDGGLEEVSNGSPHPNGRFLHLPQNTPFSSVNFFLIQLFPSLFHRAPCHNFYHLQSITFCPS